MEENKVNNTINDTQNQEINNTKIVPQEKQMQNSELNNITNPYEYDVKKINAKRNLIKTFNLISKIFIIIIIVVILNIIYTFKKYGGIMLYVYLIFGIIVVGIISFSSKISYYSKLAVSLAEKEERTAGIIGIFIGILLTTGSLFAYYMSEKGFLFILTFVGIITIINSVKYLKYY